jgi:hypothetical protein
VLCDSSKRGFNVDLLATMRARMTRDIGLVGQLVSKEICNSCGLGGTVGIFANIGRVHGNTSMIVEEGFARKYQSTLGTTVFLWPMSILEMTKQVITAQTLLTSWNCTADRFVLRIDRVFLQLLECSELDPTSFMVAYKGKMTASRAPCAVYIE